jgi:hypothetical protein
MHKVFRFLQDSSKASLKKVIGSCIGFRSSISSEAKAVHSIKANLLCLVIGTSSSVLYLSPVSWELAYHFSHLNCIMCLFSSSDTV